MTISGSGLNQYQQAVANLDQWQATIFQESLNGDLTGASSALYASAGLNADQFASLATELQKLGGTIDTSA